MFNVYSVKFGVTQVPSLVHKKTNACTILKKTYFKFTMKWNDMIMISYMTWYDNDMIW